MKWFYCLVCKRNTVFTQRGKYPAWRCIHCNGTEHTEATEKD